VRRAGSPAACRKAPSILPSVLRLAALGTSLMASLIFWSTFRIQKGSTLGNIHRFVTHPGHLPWDFQSRLALKKLTRLVTFDSRDFIESLFCFVLFCNTATQPATQLPQRRMQVVRSNKVARKRLTESNGTPAMDLGPKNID